MTTAEDTTQETLQGKELTILMPCLNEAETLAVCIRKAQSYLESAGICGEVLVADNGSTDGSQHIAQQLGARVVPVAERGYGAALMGGIAAARGRYIIMGDADDSYDFAHLDSFMDKLRKGHQLVMGNRFQGGIDAGAMPFLHKYVGNPVLSFLGRLFFKIPVGDFHCGLRGFSAAAIRGLDLKTHGMEFASEMVVKAALNGLSIAEVPTRLARDGRSRPPHLRTFRDGWRHLCFLLTLAPSWLFIYPGIILTVLGGLCVAVMMGGPAHVMGITFDLKTFIFSCLSLLVGMQSITLGVITREFAFRSGMLPPRATEPFLCGNISRDKLAMLAGVFGLVGSFLALYCVGAWAFSGFGQMQSGLFDRLTVCSFTCFAAGIQLFHSAFIYEILQSDTI